MAIQKPFSINLHGECIDASDSNLITWRVTGDTSVAYSIEIKDNQTGTTAYYLPKFTSYLTEHDLPESTLENGKEYKITITVWDASGNFATSDAEIFTTSSKPTVTLINPSDGKIGSKGYVFSANYSQAENVTIRSWVARLFNHEKKLITETSLNTSDTLEFFYEDLEDGEVYFIEFEATSIKKLTGSTGLVEVAVSYDRPHSSLDLSAENTDDGGIHLEWNVRQITGQAVNAPFIDNDKLDVTNGIVTFDSDFNIKDVFTMKLWIEELPDMTIESTPRVIASNSSDLKIVNALWLNNPSVSAERTIQIYAGSSPPSDTTSLWIQDNNQHISVSKGFSIQLNEPSTNNIWIQDEFSYDDAAIATLKGENGHLSLECFNGKLKLYKVIGDERELVAETDMYIGEQFVYIQQLESGYTLHSEQIGVG